MKDYHETQYPDPRLISLNSSQFKSKNFSLTSIFLQNPHSNIPESINKSVSLKTLLPRVHIKKKSTFLSFSTHYPQLMNHQQDLNTSISPPKSSNSTPSTPFHILLHFFFSTLKSSVNERQYPNPKQGKTILSV